MGVVRRQDGEIVILEPDGEMDSLRCEDFRLGIESLITENKLKVVVNLSGLSQIGSLGIGTLISSLTRLKKSGGDMKLSNMTDGVRKVFEVTQLNSFFKMHETESEAIQSFNG